MVTSDKKLLVLDINGLLIDTYYQQEPRPDRPHDAKVNRFYVYKRPFCNEFIRFCLENFIVGVWSSAREHNVYSLVEYMFEEAKQKLAFIWHQQHCTDTGFKHPEKKHKPVFLKELWKLWDKDDPDLPWESREYGPSNTLLIDDSAYKAIRNPPYTAIFPKTYKATDLEDNYLDSELRGYLQGLLRAGDVQEFVENNPIGEPSIVVGDLPWSKIYNSIIKGEELLVPVQPETWSAPVVPNSPRPIWDTSLPRPSEEVCLTRWHHNAARSVPITFPVNHGTAHSFRNYLDFPDFAPSGWPSRSAGYTEARWPSHASGPSQEIFTFENPTMRPGDHYSMHLDMPHDYQALGVNSKKRRRRSEDARSEERNYYDGPSSRNCDRREEVYNGTRARDYESSSWSRERKDFNRGWPRDSSNGLVREPENNHGHVDTKRGRPAGHDGSSRDRSMELIRPGASGPRHFCEPDRRSLSDDDKDHRSRNRDRYRTRECEEADVNDQRDFSRHESRVRSPSGVKARGRDRYPRTADAENVQKENRSEHRSGRGVQREGSGRRSGRIWKDLRILKAAGAGVENEIFRT